MNTRDELHELIDKLPDHDLELVGADLRARVRSAEWRVRGGETCRPTDDEHAPDELVFTAKEMAEAERQRLEAFARMEKYAEQNRAAYAALRAGAFPVEDDGSAGAS